MAPDRDPGTSSCSSSSSPRLQNQNMKEVEIIGSFLGGGRDSDACGGGGGERPQDEARIDIDKNYLRSIIERYQREIGIPNAATVSFSGSANSNNSNSDDDPAATKNSSDEPSSSWKKTSGCSSLPKKKNDKRKDPRAAYASSGESNEMGYTKHNPEGGSTSATLSNKRSRPDSSLLKQHTSAASQLKSTDDDTTSHTTHSTSTDSSQRHTIPHHYVPSRNKRSHTEQQERLKGATRKPCATKKRKTRHNPTEQHRSQYPKPSPSDVDHETDSGNEESSEEEEGASSPESITAFFSISSHGWGSTSTGNSSDVSSVNGSSGLSAKPNTDSSSSSSDDKNTSGDDDYDNTNQLEKSVGENPKNVPSRSPRSTGNKTTTEATSDEKDESGFDEKDEAEPSGTTEFKKFTSCVTSQTTTTTTKGAEKSFVAKEIQISEQKKQVHIADGRTPEAS